MRLHVSLAALASSVLLTGTVLANPAAAATVLAPTTGSSAGGPTSVFGAGFLEICTGGAPEQGTGRFVGEGDGDSFATAILNPAGDGVGTCQKIELAPGIYSIQSGKYLSARCLKHANGAPYQPVGGGFAAGDFSNARCEAINHHWHTYHDVNNDAVRQPSEDPLTTLEVDVLEVRVVLFQTTRVSAHVVPTDYPDCTLGSPSPDRICEPTGPQV